jgi:alkyl hydroperoxide reductase subunit AhpC
LIDFTVFRKSASVPVTISVPRIGYPAPEFTTQAVLPDRSFGSVSLSDYRGKWVVLFFYPLDFTFVCPTEIVAFSDAQTHFDTINTVVLGASVDSVYSHLAWINTDRKAGGLGQLQIPLLEDLTKKLASTYGVLHMETGHTNRGLFIIDPSGNLRHITMNDPPVGRNVQEIIRLVEAYQYVDEHGEVCPVNWSKGKPTMKANPSDSKSYFAQHA